MAQIKSSYKYFQLLFVVILGAVVAVHIQAADLKFFSGSNIENKDDKSYILNYSFPARTKVCFILKPTPEIKHSLPATLNRDVKGLTIIKREFNGEEAKIKAKIAGKTRVYCLCTDECEITVSELRKNTVSSESEKKVVGESAKNTVSSESGKKVVSVESGKKTANVELGKKTVGHGKTLVIENGALTVQ